MGGSPTIELAYVLAKVFSAIILGFVCRRTGVIVPEDGDSKSLNFFVGRVAFPLLIFNTIATAELRSIDFGTVLACGCAKLLVFWSAWVLGYLAYGKSSRRQQRGQRILTATVFGFLTVASDDFATGFPVIKAIYGDDMTVYIAANSVVGSFVMVPMTLVLLEVGSIVQTREQGDAGVETESVCQIQLICRNIVRNPVIAMTILGLLFQVCLGRWCLKGTEGVSRRFAEPVNGIIKYWTEPFGMLALFSTGLSLRSARIRFWPMLLVSFKLLVCAYLSYALGLLVISGEPREQLQDFAFFYGSIPSSSAPLVFASQFDASVVELVAAAILAGYVMAGPNMFIIAMFLSRESSDMTETLNAVQGVAGIASATGAGLVLSFVALTYTSWSWSGAVLGIYAGIVLCYGVIDSHLAASCDSSLRFELFLFNWFQKASFLLVLYMQFLQSSKWKRPHVRGRSLVVLFLLSATVLSFAMPVEALDRLCHLQINPLANTLCSSLQLAAILGLSAWDLVRGRRQAASEDSFDVGGHPVGAAKTLCVVQGLRTLMQVVNGAAVAFQGSAWTDSVRGGFVQMMIIEHVLEAGQGIFCLFAVLLQDLNRERCIAAGNNIGFVARRLSCRAPPRQRHCSDVNMLPFLDTSNGDGNDDCLQ